LYRKNLQQSLKPVSPSGPVEPVSPDGPVGPTTPVLPVSPRNPSAPVLPIPHDLNLYTQFIYFTIKNLNFSWLTVGPT